MARRIREELGVTQEEWAEQLGVSRSSVQRMESHPDELLSPHNAYALVGLLMAHDRIRLAVFLTSSPDAFRTSGQNIPLRALLDSKP